jgi:hypothetical protein
MEGSCEYIEYAVANSRQGCGFGMGLNTHRQQKVARYKKFHKGLGLECIFVSIKRTYLL